MSVREPVASPFYDRALRSGQIEVYLDGFEVPKEPSRILGAIVPHAGWAYSGAVAAKVFKTLQAKEDPATLILLGSVHTLGVQRASVYARGSWATPRGAVEVDTEVSHMLLDSLGDLLVEDPQAHSREHSLEVQLPFLQYFFPRAKIVPIMVVPDPSSSLIGRQIGEAILSSKKPLVVMGTTDLTHYGNQYGFAPKGYGPQALQWMKANDARILRLAMEMRSEEIVQEAALNHNACGAGALAATISAARAAGAKRGLLLDYTTSHDVSGEGEFRMGVGYAGLLFAG